MQKNKLLIDKFCQEVTHNNQPFDYDILDEVLLYFTEDSAEYKKNTKKRKQIILEMDRLIYKIREKI